MAETFNTGALPDSRSASIQSLTPTETSNLNSVDLMIAAAPAPQLKGAAAPVPARAPEAACPPSKELNTYIDVASRHMYDPTSLGDFVALERTYACNVHNAADVIKFGNLTLAGTGDKYNHFMDAGEVKQFQQMQSGHYAGIGIVLDTAEAGPKAHAPSSTFVKEVRTGLPADKAGIKAGDAIVKVDGKDVSHDTMAHIQSLITAGEPGTKVDLVVQRAGKPVEQVITRAHIDNAPVVHDKVMGNGIVKIKIDSFMDGGESDQLKAMLEKHKDARAFIIDLRGNGGGFVNQAIASEELLIQSGKLMSTRERVDSPAAHPLYQEQVYNLDANHLDTLTRPPNSTKVSSTLSDRLPYLGAGRPVVILTDEHTASASEMFTGAMHDTGHATVIGTKSYGKGIAQNFYFNQPDGGGVKVTATHYFTPSGHWPGDAANHKNPLLPDLNVENPKGTVNDSPSDQQLNSAMRYLNAKLKP